MFLKKFKFITNHQKHCSNHSMMDSMIQNDDYIGHNCSQLVLKQLKNDKLFSKMTFLSTTLYRLENFTNELLKIWQTTMEHAHLSQHNISTYRQWWSDGQSVSQFDHVFAKTLF